MRLRRTRWAGVLLTVVGLALQARPARAADGVEGLERIDHIVVLYLENRSFDHLFGSFPGANGLANAGAAAIQTDAGDRPYKFLPAPLDLRRRPPAPYAAITERLPNRPFPLDRYFRPDRNPVIVKVLGKETVDLPAGKFNTIVIQPIIKSKGIFSDKGEAKIWLSDDKDRIMVQMRVKLIRTTINLQLTSHRPATTNPGP